jgi:O-antigen/teichoic acid export membrane protein
MSAPTPDPTVDAAAVELDEIRSRASAGALKLGVRNVAIRALGLVGTIILARLLKPADFGLVALGLSLQLIGNVLATGGLGAELIRRAEPPRELELRCVLGYQLLAGLVVATVATAIAIAVGGSTVFFVLIALSIPIATLNTPGWIVLSRDLDWNLIALSEVVGTVVFNLFAVGLVIAGLGVEAVGAAVLAQTVVTVTLLNRRGPVGLVRPSLDPGTIGPLLRFGLAFQASSLLERGRDQAVNILTAAIGGLALLGVWSAAYRIFLSIALVFEALWQVSFPAMARMLEAGQDARALVEGVLRINSTAFGFPAVAVAGTAPALVPVLFGPGFGGAVDVLPWGAAALLLTGPTITAGMSFVKARGDGRGMIESYVVQSVVWLASAAALIPLFGAQGVGMAMFIAALALVASISRAARRYVEIRILAVVWAPFAAVAVGGVAGWAIAASISSHALGLVISLGVCELVYVGLLMAMRRSDLESLFTTLLGAFESAFPRLPQIRRLGLPRAN